MQLTYPGQNPYFVKIGAFFTASRGKTITLHAVRKGMSEDRLKEFLELRYAKNHVLNIEHPEPGKKKRKKKTSESESENSDQEHPIKPDLLTSDTTSGEPRTYYRSTTIKV